MDDGSKSAVCHQKTWVEQSDVPSGNLGSFAAQAGGRAGRRGVAAWCSTVPIRTVAQAPLVVCLPRDLRWATQYPKIYTAGNEWQQIEPKFTKTPQVIYTGIARLVY